MIDYNNPASTRVSRTQGRIRGTGWGMSYPSPFFDVAHTYLPDTVKQMFRWCRYYTLTNPLIAAVVNKMAEYPITDIIIDTDNDGTKKLWVDFFEDTLQLRAFLVDIGLFYMTYGNALVSVNYPFRKFLQCRKCKKMTLAHKAKYRFRNFKFFMDCGCGHHDEAEVKDVPIRSAQEIRLILWSPEDITIKYNDLTGRSTYYYTVPINVKNDIVMGKRSVVTQTPQIFIDAVRRQKSIILNPDNIFHFRRPSILTGSKDKAWGVPLVLPVLKDVFYLQILKKAQESIALERIVPLTVLFPQPGSGSSDPYATISLSKWREQVGLEVQRWRFDRNYLPIMPLPIGSQNIGGDGRALLLGQEIRIWSEHIIAGMGVPQEFVFGGLQYSGSNVSLRMLENQLLRYVSDQLRMIKNFVVKNVAAWMDWPHVNVRFKPFKMADDLQRRALDLQINQAGKLSDTSLLANLDYDPIKEDELMAKETIRRLEAVGRQQRAEAQIAVDAQVIQAKGQAKIQQVMNQEQQQAMQGQANTAPGEAQEGQQQQPQGQQQQQGQQGQQQQGGDQGKQQMAQQMAQRLAQYPPDQQQQIIQQIAQQDPELAQLVQQMLKQQMSGQQQGSQVAGQPQPEQLPPRRGPESAAI